MKIAPFIHSELSHSYEMGHYFVLWLTFDKFLISTAINEYLPELDYLVQYIRTAVACVRTAPFWD